jgi:phosphoribosylpyrophosphate synthetase
MGLFDFIRHITDPGIMSEFDELYRNYRRGLELKYSVLYGLNHSPFSQDIPFAAKKALVEAKDEIIAMDKAINDYSTKKRTVHIIDESNIVKAKNKINRYPSAAKKLGYNTAHISESKAKEIIDNEDLLDEIQTLEFTHIKLSDQTLYINHTPVKYFIDYYPIKVSCSARERAKSELIRDFKDGKYEARTKIIPMVTEYLFSLPIKKHLNKVVFVCTPASSLHAYRIRFGGFTTRITELTGMINGNKHVSIFGEVQPKHLGGRDAVCYSIDENFFKDKWVIILDDLITTGTTLMEFADRIKSAGGKIIITIAIGRTKHLSL